MAHSIPMQSTVINPVHTAAIAESLMRLPTTAAHALALLRTSWLLLETSSYHGPIIAAPRIRCHRFDLRPAFLFERLGLAARLNALSNACIAALNYNVLHHMCSTLGAPSWRTRIERTSHELHSQDSQNPCSHLLCFGHRQPRHRRVGIATGGLDSTYGSYATLAAVVLIAKGLVDLAAASPVSRAPTSLRRWTARLSSVLLPRSPRLPKRCSRFPRLAATPSTLAPLSSWCTTCSLFSRHTPLRPRTRTAYKRSLLITLQPGN